jgi:hypothetical protein
LAGVPNLHLGVTPSSAMNPYPYTITVVSPPTGPLFGWSKMTP